MTLRPKKTPSSGALKSWLDATKIDTVVLGDVDRHLQLKVRDRRTDIIHPSEMARADWCARATYLRMTGHSAEETPERLRSMLIFGEGHDIHHKWQRWFREMGILFGRWVCLACGRDEMAEIGDIPVRGCPHQVDGKHLWDYREVPLEDPVRKIAGHSDGLIFPAGKNYLVEIKSVGPGTIRKLVLAPEDTTDEHLSTQFGRISHMLGDHYRQLQIYMRLTQSTSRPVKRGLGLYENKADQQIKEFAVEYDERSTEDLFAMAADISWSIDKGRDVLCNQKVGGCAQCSRYEVT
jgi:CRISPR/Cas system-associated exonuclease Cas4 (RecB family)